MTSTASTCAILIVDDSPVYHKLVGDVLANEPYTLLFAASGEEALSLFSAHSPSIVITDWNMPDFSGLELCKRIRALPNCPYAYILVVTSNADKESVVQGLAAGADDYLTKPFDPGELLARVGVGRRIITLNRQNDVKSKLLEEEARTDTLTGLPNRRAIEEWASRQLRGAARHRFPLWVALADIDSFKGINDTYGHAAGDAVLQTFAELLKRNTRSSDICGRLGGDEFVLVITHVNAENIQLTLEKFREQFAALSFPFVGQSMSTSASFGAAGFSMSREMPVFSVLLKKADEALYEAKREGRNRVAVRFCPSSELEPTCSPLAGT
jgi:two-component system, cell cycle response regulator